MFYDTIENALKTNLKAVVVSEREYEHKGHKRVSITAKKAKGRRTYLIVRYENGLYSEAV